MASRKLYDTSKISSPNELMDFHGLQLKEITENGPLECPLLNLFFCGWGDVWEWEAALIFIPSFSRIYLEKVFRFIISSKRV